MPIHTTQTVRKEFYRLWSYYPASEFSTDDARADFELIMPLARNIFQTRYPEVNLEWEISVDYDIDKHERRVIGYLYAQVPIDYEVETR